MKKCFLIAMVCIMGNVLGQAADSIPDIPVSIDEVADSACTAVGIIGGSVTINDLIDLKPTISNLDVVNLPKVKSNAFGIDVSDYIGDAQKIFRTTYSSKNKFYGQDLMQDKSVYKWGINYDLSEFYDGLYFDVETTSPAGTYSGNSDDASQIIYKMYQVSVFNPGSKNEVQLTIQETYYDLQEADLGSDGQELGVGIAFTNMFVGDDYQIVPRIYYGKVWNLAIDEAGDTTNEYDGSVIVAGADYYKTINGMLINFYGEATYVEGFDSSDSELTHAQFGVSTDLSIDQGLIITPSIHYAHYFDDSAVDGGESDSTGDVWASLTVSYPF